MNTEFYNKDGTLTRYALACGYVERCGSTDSYVVLEQISSNGTLRVHVGGRYAREDVYVGHNLKTARSWFRKTDHRERNRIAMEAQP